jgi:hypothetical protein
MSQMQTDLSFAAVVGQLSPRQVADSAVGAAPENPDNERFNSVACVMARRI